MRRKIVAVIGGHDCTKKVEQLSHKLGINLKKVVNTLVCGGLSGVMEAVCKGFKSKNNVTIGIIPTYDKNTANKYIDIVIPTGLGLARNVLVVKTADVVIALPGKAGTLSEIAYCLQFGVPVIGFKPWNIPGVAEVGSVAGAIKKVKEILRLKG
ncbi:MAG: TIGR00725 family protein [Candidatus Omnitrophota bacterium]